MLQPLDRNKKYVGVTLIMDSVVTSTQKQLTVKPSLNWPISNIHYQTQNSYHKCNINKMANKSACNY